jgi:hypothetical protein
VREVEGEDKGKQDNLHTQFHMDPHPQFYRSIRRLNLHDNKSAIHYVNFVIITFRWKTEAESLIRNRVLTREGSNYGRAIEYFMSKDTFLHILTSKFKLSLDKLDMVCTIRK